jgi:predicted amino acid racemase
VSFNTEIDTIKMLSAKKQNKTHKIIIMIEMGDLREGVMGRLIEFYGHILSLPTSKFEV